MADRWWDDAELVDSAGGTGAPSEDRWWDAAPVADAFEGESFGDLVRRRGQQFAAGATDVIAAVPEAAAIRAPRAAERRAEDMAGGREQRAETIRQMRERLDDPSLSPDVRQHIEGQLADLEIGQGAVGQRIASERDRAAVPVTEQPGWLAGQRIRENAAQGFGAPDPADQSFWGKVAQGAGNMTAFATAALAGPVTGTAAGAGLGASMNQSSMYREALEAGADEETARDAAEWGAAIGATEIIPISRALHLLPPRLRARVGQGVMRKFADVAQGAGEEAAHEYLATVANNIVSQQLYDPERGWTEGATEGALVGAILGGGIGAVGTAINRQSNLTPQDRASPLPNDLISRGKEILAEADKRSQGPETPTQQGSEASASEPAASPEEPPLRLENRPASVARDREEEPQAEAPAAAEPQATEPASFEDMDEIDAAGTPTGRRVRVNLDTGEAQVITAEEPSAATSAREIETYRTSLEEMSLAEVKAMRKKRRLRKVLHPRPLKRSRA